MKKHLTFKDQKSDKFWSIEVKGKSFTVTYGKTGTAGQVSTKDFDTEEKCMKEAEKLINEKLKKGYEERIGERTKPSGPKFMSVEEIIGLLKKNELADVERGIMQFSHYTELNQSHDKNPTYTFFGLKKKSSDDPKLVEIEILSSLLSKFKTKLSSESLSRIIKATLSSDIYDNFHATIEAIKIAIERKDIAAQNTTVQSFKSACEYYDAGHRLCENTVQDQLIDDLFPQFEGEPLVNLLTWCSSDYLMNDGGLDGMDALFRPAFEKIKDPVLEKKLLDFFIEYVEECDEDYKNSGILSGYDGASPKVKAAVKKLKGEEEEDDSLSNKRRFEFSDGSSNKFWEVEIEDESYTVTYGKIGTDGVTQTKSFDDHEECNKQVEKLIAEKVKKGYEEKSSGAIENTTKPEQSGPVSNNSETEKAVKKLIAKFEKPGIKWTAQCDAIDNLANYSDPRVVPLLMKALRHKENAVVRDAMYGLGLQKANEAVPFLIAKLKSEESQHITAAACALSKIGNEPAIAALTSENNYKYVLKMAWDDIDGRFSAGALHYFQIKNVNDDLFSLLTKSDDMEVQEKARDGLIYRCAEEKIAPCAKHVLLSNDPKWEGRWLVALMVGISAKITSLNQNFLEELASIFSEANPTTMKQISEGGKYESNGIKLLPPDAQENVFRWRQALCSKMKSEKQKELVAKLLTPHRIDI